MAVAPEDLARTLLRRSAARLCAEERARALALEEVRSRVGALRARWGFGRAWLIGSLAWGRFGERSDIDLVIEHASDVALAAIGDDIGSATGRVVDVLALDELPESFATRVLAEGLHVA